MTSSLKFASCHLKKKSALALAVFWSIVFVLVPMQVPVLTGALIDGINGKESVIYGFIELNESPEGILKFAILGLMAVAAAYGLSGYFRKTSTAKVSRHFVSELRKSLIEKIEFMPLDAHGKYGSGELLNRAIIDTQAMRRFIENVLVKTPTNIARVAYPFVMLFAIDPSLAFTASSILPVQWAITNRLQKKLHRASRQSRTTQSGLTTVVKENLDGIEAIQTSNAEKISIGKISEHSERLESDELRANKYSALITGSVWALTSIGIALTWWQGGMRVLSGEMTIGTLVVFTGFVAFIYSPFRRFTDVINVYQKGIVAVERIQEILDAPSSIKESLNAAPLAITHGNIQFDGVSFSYSDREVLSGIDLEIDGRGLTAVVGRSGSGKSSLLRLIMRLHDPSQGRILIDGVDIKEATLDSLRSQIAVVPQTPFIFSGTVRENILLGKPESSDKEIEKACRTAGAMAFISKLDRGLDTRLGHGGVSLSGGETQRIAIARALLRKPKILLLDEPTSALDSESEWAIMAGLQRLKEEMTIVMVGHHLKTISRADRLIVMDGGKVVEDGTHRELISSRSVYRDLYIKGGFQNERLKLGS